jgi:hypothetical protein
LIWHVHVQYKKLIDVYHIFLYVQNIEWDFMDGKQYIVILCIFFINFCDSAYGQTVRLTSTPTPTPTYTKTATATPTTTLTSTLTPTPSGTWFSKTPTVTPTMTQPCDFAMYIDCDSVVYGDTRGKVNNYTSYGCFRPARYEGPEDVYEFWGGTISDIWITDTRPDVDIILLRDCDPDVCEIILGDHYNNFIFSWILYTIIIDSKFPDGATYTLYISERISFDPGPVDTPVMLAVLIILLSLFMFYYYYRKRIKHNLQFE